MSTIALTPDQVNALIKAREDLQAAITLFLTQAGGVQNLGNRLVSLTGYSQTFGSIYTAYLGSGNTKINTLTGTFPTEPVFTITIGQ